MYAKAEVVGQGDVIRGRGSEFRETAEKDVERAVHDVSTSTQRLTSMGPAEHAAEDVSTVTRGLKMIWNYSGLGNPTVQGILLGNVDRVATNIGRYLVSTSQLQNVGIETTIQMVLPEQFANYVIRGVRMAEDAHVWGQRKIQDMGRDVRRVGTDYAVRPAVEYIKRNLRNRGQNKGTVLKRPTKMPPTSTSDEGPTSTDPIPNTRIVNEAMKKFNDFLLQPGTKLEQAQRLMIYTTVGVIVKLQVLSLAASASGRRLF
jgi:hypothetical protein